MNSCISVIVPVYNTEDYLEKCITSIISQTYKNLEIIIIDDGSTDSSSKICDELSKTDNRIIVIHQKNKGVSEARNTALEISHGDLIAFIDSDDYIDNNYFEILTKTMEQENATSVFCRCIIEDDKGNLLNNIQSYNKDLSVRNNNINFFENNGFRAVVRSKLYKRDVIIRENNFIKFSSKLCIGEDSLFAAQVLMNESCITICKKPMYHWVQHTESVTHSHNIEKLLSEIDAWQEICCISKFNDSLYYSARMEYCVRCKRVLTKASEIPNINKQTINYLVSEIKMLYPQLKNCKYIDKKDKIMCSVVYFFGYNLFKLTTNILKTVKLIRGIKC